MWTRRDPVRSDIGLSWSSQTGPQATRTVFRGRAWVLIQFTNLVKGALYVAFSSLINMSVGQKAADPRISVRQFLRPYFYFN